MRQPGIEPGSIAWKATMLTFTPPTLVCLKKYGEEVNKMQINCNRTRIYCLEGSNANLYTIDN